MNIFAERLKGLRKDRGFTQSYVCEQVLPQGEYENQHIEKVLSNYENGKRKPGYEIIVEFARFYNVTTDYLLGVSEYENEKNISIHEATGLSDKSIQSLQGIKNFRKAIMDTLNYILEKGETISLLIDIEGLSMSGINAKKYEEYLALLSPEERSEYVKKTSEVSEAKFVEQRKCGEYPTITLSPLQYKQYMINSVKEKVYKLLQDITNEQIEAKESNINE